MLRIFVFLFLLVNVTAEAALEEGFVAMPDGARLYYSKYGDGANKVVLPAGLFLEKHFAGLAGKNRTLIFYDMRNRGRSDYVQNASTLTLQQDIADLEALRKHFKFDRFSLVGISYLGKMVVIYAAQYPQHVERVIQIGAVPLKFGTEYPSKFAASDSASVMDAETRKELEHLKTQGYDRKYPRDYCEKQWDLFRPVFVGNPANASKIDSPCDMPNEWPIHFSRHLDHHFASVQKLEVPRETITKIQQPVLTIHGTKDRNAPYGGGREWAFLLPNARLLSVAGAAHYPWVEAPEIVMPAIDEFLNGRWPDSAEKVTDDPVEL